MGLGNSLGDDDDDDVDVDKNASYSGTRLICYPLAPPRAITTTGTGTTTTTKNAKNKLDQRDESRKVDDAGRLCTLGRSEERRVGA